MTDRIAELKELLLEPRPEEVRFRNIGAACTALAAWFALALREPLLLLEVPILVFLYVKLVAVWRREAAYRGDRIEDWSF